MWYIINTLARARRVKKVKEKQAEIGLRTGHNYSLIANQMSRCKQVT